MSSVLHTFNEVKAEVGVILESIARRLLFSFGEVDLEDAEDFLMTTPLFQTSFVPDLMQVNFLPEAVEVDPAFVHLAPALGVAA
jgi:hypothetical protein